VPYRLLDHTADLALEVTAATLDTLFAEAAAALTDCLTEIDRVEGRAERRFALAAGDLEALLVDWLSEVLYAFEVDRFLLREAAVTVEAEAAGGPRLRAVARGETLDPRRHAGRVSVKGITYHGLEVRATAEGWAARVVLDV